MFKRFASRSFLLAVALAALAPAAFAAPPPTVQPSGQVVAKPSAVTQTVTAYLPVMLQAVEVSAVGVKSNVEPLAPNPTKIAKRDKVETFQAAATAQTIGHGAETFERLRA